MIETNENKKIDYFKEVCDIRTSNVYAEMDQSSVLSLYKKLFGTIPNILDLSNKYPTIDFNKTSERMAKLDDARVFWNLVIIIRDNFIIKISPTHDIFTLFSIDKKYELPEDIKKCIKRRKVKKFNGKYIDYVTIGGGGFDTTQLEVRKIDNFNISNYNDDLPDKKINEFIESKNSGLAILHGKPGTGKTTYIRNLIYNSKQNFIYMDASTFNSITSLSLFRLLKYKENSVIILEDCETLLYDRMVNGTNPLLSGLLNLCDGILGDGLSLKFICTFNCDLNKTDDALLRKGRLKVKYEFGELTNEKAKEIAKKNNIVLNEDEPFTLANIFNGNEQVVFNEKKKKKIGFND